MAEMEEFEKMNYFVYIFFRWCQKEHFKVKQLNSGPAALGHHPTTANNRPRLTIEEADRTVAAAVVAVEHTTLDTLNHAPS